VNGASHVVMVSHSDAVAKLIDRAATAPTRRIRIRLQASSKLVLESIGIDGRRNTMILQDKVALVTGGASGIGRATAIACS